ncbi:retrovirus-related pol polyprotein from transposon TNT 1-94 [Tanacetum coccineum]|uniref:Retrovirus-related pol polyprotein from transposon TNT 1-94 n=1 Tax=Tanacetum coccineum TaxID=301880 RepID=A0ABQ4XMX4_9ASTR
MINLHQFLVTGIWFKEISRSRGFITLKASITISSRLVNSVMRIWRLHFRIYLLRERFSGKRPTYGLSHLNFDTINLLSKKDIVNVLPKLKYVKDQLCSSCELIKAKRSTFKIKIIPSLKGWLNLLHMDLCGPMRTESINEKKYILVIVDDYSRYTWTLFLRTKDETPKVLKDFLKMIQQNLQAQVITVRTERGTKFLNKTLHAYIKEEADTDAPSLQELGFLFSPLYDELFTAGNTSVSKSSSLSDNSPQQDTQPTVNVQPISEPITPTTTVYAEENNNNQAEDARFEPYEFINPFCTPIQEIAESSSQQVRGNPSKLVQARRQLATDLEICMFALTVSTAEPSNIKEAMDDHARIEAMQ